MPRILKQKRCRNLLELLDYRLGTCLKPGPNPDSQTEQALNPKPLLKHPNLKP